MYVVKRQRTNGAITRSGFCAIDRIKGANMKFKTVLPYLLVGSMMGIPKPTGDFHKIGDPVHTQIVTTPTNSDTQKQIENKAKELCDTYIDLVLQGQENIKDNNKRYGHRKSVLKELPGAPVYPKNLYCIYGQYTQLNRALDSLNDTLTLIPYGGRNSCPAFRDVMRTKYKSDEYAGALHNGKMFKSDEDYNRALNAYLKHNHVTDETPLEKRNEVIARFEKNNFYAGVLHPGAILIIQKSANPNNTHAVMYIGRGHVENNQFIEDADGQFIYAGYNNESLGDIFKTYNTNHIFAADIYNIAMVDYGKELEKIQNMDNKELYYFVYDIPNDLYAFGPNREYLEKMATEKYVNNENFVPQYPVVQPNLAGISIIPRHDLLIKKLGLLSR